MTNPGVLIEILKDAIKDKVQRDHPKVLEYFEVTFSGSFGIHAVSPRGLLSNFLDWLVSVEGIVTKVSVVRPKVKKSVHYCKATKKHVMRRYRDATSLDGPATTSVYPTKDEQGT